MEKLRDVKAALEPVAAVFDGLGLSDGEMPADSVGTGMGHKQNFVMTDSADSGSHCYDGLVYVPLAATKHPMNNPPRGSGFVLSAGFKVRKVVHVHKGVICQKRLESLLAARNVI